ncbi:MAG: hypothetical protein OEL57_08200 [Trichlorobacter sp.]|uniref:hypothetical protein n=1 Tax=Trichlorobacter sp. TaxID=2911007 RepID=UPI00255DF1AA|nr:hypothetical protein [Trichlorobacter sp.]MDK9717874.1 hypothetical protein [Trichlorobacter sp.]
MILLRFFSLFFISLCLVQVASAGPCASYLDQKSGYRLLFQPDGTVQEYNKDGVVQAVHQYYRAGQSVWLRNFESGYSQHYQFVDNGKQLKKSDSSWGDTIYIQQQRNSCPSLQKLAYLTKPECSYGKEKECCAAGDSNACVGEAHNSDNIPVLQRQCRTQPQACLALLELYDKAANKRDTPFSGMYAEKMPLPAAQLDEIADSCSRFKTPDLCRKAAQQLWRAQRFSQTARLFEAMCKANLDEHACARHKQLINLQFPKTLAPATTPPCGEYRSTVSALSGTMVFKDRGMVTVSLGSQLRARLEDGLIKLRHDKGGDFIFARLSDTILLGMDDWNNFEVYRRETPPQQLCQAPVIYKEEPLSSNCGLDKDPAVCCQAGDTQGCNRLGSMAALVNNWKEAALQYAKVCEKGVRVGCENWIYTVGKTGDESVEEGLKKLCAKDDHHVACDLLETDRVTQAMLGYELEKMLKETKTEQPAKNP